MKQICTFTRVTTLQYPVSVVCTTCNSSADPRRPAADLIDFLLVLAVLVVRKRGREVTGNELDWSHIPSFILPVCLVTSSVVSFAVLILVERLFGRDWTFSKVKTFTRKASKVFKMYLGHVSTHTWTNRLQKLNN